MIFSWCTRRVRRIFRRTRSKINGKIERAILTVRSLTYNSHINKDYVIDFLLGPLFWIVDNFAGYLGKFFVFAVVVLTSAVVFIAYWLGLPYWWERNENMTFFLVAFGNWILINIVFNYYKGVTTSPGFPPEGKNIPQVSSICKKCLKLKPPRTHHCSVCDRCIIGMDHHCPWLNNCVGYFNARYFFLYMAYLLMGVMFLMTAGLDIGYVAIYLNDTGILIKHDDPDLIGHPVRRNKSGVLIPGSDVEYDINIFPRFHDLPVPMVTEAQRIAANPLKKRALIFVAVSCVCVFIAMSTLVIIHGKQITRGETSIEAHTNANLRKRSRRFRNPYNFGFKENWRTFLGLNSGRTFFRHILFPSSHSPDGTGLTWRIVRAPLNGRQFI